MDTKVILGLIFSTLLLILFRIPMFLGDDKNIEQMQKGFQRMRGVPTMVLALVIIPMTKKVIKTLNEDKELFIKIKEDRQHLNVLLSGNIIQIIYLLVWLVLYVFCFFILYGSITKIVNNAFFAVSIFWQTEFSLSSMFFMFFGSSILVIIYFPLTYLLSVILKKLSATKEIIDRINDIDSSIEKLEIMINKFEEDIVKYDELSILRKNAK